MRNLREIAEETQKAVVLFAQGIAQRVKHSGEDRLTPWQEYRLLSSYKFYGIKGIKPSQEGVGYMGQHEDANGIQTKICFMEYTPANDPLVTIICMKDVATGERKEELYIK
jgi:hypothetical protein